MPRPGLKAVHLTLSDEDTKTLDSLGDSRSEVVARLVRQEAIARQQAAENFESTIAVIAQVKKKFPEFSREQAVELIIFLVRAIAE